MFTRNLEFLSRNEAAELVAKRGGIPQNSVTKITHYIVVGDFGYIHKTIGNASSLNLSF